MIPLEKIIYYNDQSLLEEFERKKIIHNTSVLADLAIRMHNSKSPEEQIQNPFLFEIATSYLKLRKSCIVNYWIAFHEEQKYANNSTHNTKIFEESIQNFFVYGKSSMDLLVCLAQVILTGSPKLKDAESYASVGRIYNIDDNYVCGILKNKLKENAFTSLTDVRDKIIHRGYSIILTKIKCEPKLVLHRLNNIIHPAGSGSINIVTGGNIEDPINLDEIAKAYFIELSQIEDGLLTRILEIFEKGNKVYGNTSTNSIKDLQSIDLNNYYKPINNNA